MVDSQEDIVCISTKNSIWEGFGHINKAINKKWCLKHINKAINKVH